MGHFRGVEGQTLIGLNDTKIIMHDREGLSQSSED